MKINIQEATIVRLDDDKETPWLVIHIDENSAENMLSNSEAATLVWIRKMGRSGKTFVNLPKWEAHNDIVTMNRLWIA